MSKFDRFSSKTRGLSRNLGPERSGLPSPTWPSSRTSTPTALTPSKSILGAPRAPPLPLPPCSLPFFDVWFDLCFTCGVGVPDSRLEGVELADVGDVRLVEVVAREDHDAGDRQSGLKVNPYPGLSKKKYFVYFKNSDYVLRKQSCLQTPTFRWDPLVCR